MQSLLNFINTLGRVTLNFLRVTGEGAEFTAKVVTACVRRPFYHKELIRQMI